MANNKSAGEAALRSAIKAAAPCMSSAGHARLASQLLGILERCVAEGWDPENATLHIRGARRNSLGATLKNLRESAGLTQEDVTHRFGWHAAKLSRIESGTVKIARYTLETLLRHYGAYTPNRFAELWKLAIDTNVAVTTRADRHVA